MNAEHRKKRILQISNYYYPELGGIEKIAQAISNSVRGVYEEKVICFTHEKYDRTDWVNTTEVIRFGTKLKVASQQLSLSLALKMKKIINEFNSDIIIVHAPNPYTELLLMNYIGTEIKLIVYWHSDIIKQKIGEKLFRGMTIKLLNRADKIVATSPNYIEDSYYLSKYEEKCVVIPNCIEEESLIIDEEIECLSKKIREDNEGKIICVGIGRQVPYKGFEYVVQAMQKLDNRFELFLIGRSGESTEKIKKLAKGMPNVRLIGEIDNKMLKAYLCASDIFCFPSITKNEAFGIALAEAMYFGKPAVTFTIPGSGVNYVNLNNKTGIEIENRNIEDYAKALSRLANDSDLRNIYGINAKDRVENMFLYKHYKISICNLLKELIY